MGWQVRTIKETGIKKTIEMAKLIINWLLAFTFLITTQITEAQNNYEPIHSPTGYDYIIKGELELKITNAIDFKSENKNKEEGTYTIKSPVFLAFNLNDLKFFKAQPKEFVGYVEDQYIPSVGWFATGSLMDIGSGYGEAENWMWVDEHVKWWEDGKLTEIKAHGEIEPDIKVVFSIPIYSEKYKAGLGNLQFRIAMKISGNADTQRNVTVEYDSRKPQESGMALMDDASLKELEKADSSAVAGIKEGLKLMQEASGSHPSDLFVKVGCGIFYGADLVNAEMVAGLIEVEKSKKEVFEAQFEQKYFKDLPHINVMKLVNFLLKPVGNYETPIVGSFSSDSEFGSEKATYEGTLRLWGNQFRKDE